MYNPFSPPQPPSVIDPVIETLISEMSGHDASDETYTTMAMNLKTLVEAKAAEPKPARVPPETIVAVVGNIVAIGIILAFEKNGVITSRAFGLIGRNKTP